MERIFKGGLMEKKKIEKLGVVKKRILFNKSNKPKNL
jgi:hypothetical protein